MKLCKCGKEVKITGDRCEDCFAEGTEYSCASRTGLNLAERVKYNLWQGVEGKVGPWAKRGRKVRK
jgi:aromatic ring-cleaving dioxygenase